jgi:hypothetical protein
MVRPNLFVNGRKASVELLKNVSATVEIRDFIDMRSNSKNYEKLQFNDDKEVILSFQVPPNMMSLSVSLKCEVQNVTQKKTQSFSASHSLVVKEHKLDYVMSELYLRRQNKDYYLYLLGRNGEPKQSKISVQLTHHNKNLQSNGHD